MGKKINFFGLKILKFFDEDPGSEILLTLGSGTGISIPDPQHYYRKRTNWFKADALKPGVDVQEKKTYAQIPCLSSGSAIAVVLLT